MTNHRASIDIAASPEAVWAVLADMANWTDFDIYCYRLEGRAALGATVTTINALEPDRVATLEVITFDRPHCLAWRDRRWPFGALDRVRTHTVTAQGRGSHVEVSEVVTGPLAGWLGGRLPDPARTLPAFCEGLKRWLEAPE